MKRITKLLFMLTLVVAMIGATNTRTAKAEEEHKIIYAQVPSDWSTPCLWAWSSDGTNAFDAWPGQAMTQDPNNAGWYYCYVPAFVTNVIVNANEGTVQTTDLLSEAQNSWITVVSAEEATLVHEALTQGDFPEYIALEQTATETETETTEVLPETTEMITVHAKAPADWLYPSLWAWSAPDGTNVFANWPGQEMTLEGDWYVYEVPAWVNSIIINGNVGTVQTSDLSIEGKDVWVVVSDAENAEVFYEEPATNVVEETKAPTTKPTQAPTSTQAKEDTTAATNDDTAKKDSNSTLIIVIIVVAAVAVLAIVGVIVSKKKKA